MSFTLLKDKFFTTSSKSFTSNKTPVQFIKGVGPKLGSIFESHGIKFVSDLLLFLPRSYEDRREVVPIREATHSSQVSIQIRVLSHRVSYLPKQKRKIHEVISSDGEAQLLLKWFYPPPGLQARMPIGSEWVVSGKVTFYRNQASLIHPELSKPQGEGLSPHLGVLIPIYPELEGISPRTLRTILWNALESHASELEEDLPSHLLEKWKLPCLSQTLRAIHFPTEIGEFFERAKSRMIYEEFFKFQLLILKKKEAARQFSASSFPSENLLHELMGRLPFQITQGQKKALEELLSDLNSQKPMNRLLQGDVGCGKTIVALLSAAVVLEGGSQVALMVPTEILAEQHFGSLKKFFNDRLPGALLTGRSSVSQRREIQDRLDRKEPLLVIGTHALIEDAVRFHKLDYVIIDEQHRFGVDQRKKLWLKGCHQNRRPHSLILSATPIPRTLALSAFGDLSLTMIRELPPGRSPIKTVIAQTPPQRQFLFDFLQKEIQNGRQAYVIYPLVNQSESEGFTHLKAATIQKDKLSASLPGVSIDLLHGQLSSQEKNEVMLRFKEGLSSILVSTTVVEVGVDNPNATLMIVEHAERFGLSQLHQLRGRVGRGRYASFCYLISRSQAERLKILEETQDGFQIAEADLKLRGPGEFLGTRQAGELPFKFADIVRDQDWLLRAHLDAEQTLQDDFELTLKKNQCLRSYYHRQGQAQMERFQIA